MKRRLLLALILVLILGLPAWGGYYLLWTPGGVRWAFKAVSYFSPLRLSAQRVEGRIAGLLILEKVQAEWADGNVMIRQLRSRLNPYLLLRGKIGLEEITGSGITLNDQKKSQEPLDLSLPRVSGLLARANLEIRSFQFKNITYRKADAPRVIELLEGRLSWKRGILAASPFSVKGDPGRLEGSFILGFSMPMIEMNIQWTPEKPWQGLDQFVFQGRLRSIWPGKDLTGPISIKGRMNHSDRFFFQADLSMAPQRIDIRSGSLRETGRKGFVSGQGRVLFERIGPAFQALLTLKDLDLSREASTVLILSGPLRLTGNPDQFTGTFDLENKVRSWQAFKLAGSFQRKQTGLDITLARGEWLKGSVQGTLGIALDKGISIDGFLKGRQLRPEVINPHWSGLINLDARGQFSRSLAGLNQGTWAVKLLESRFQDRTLQGEIRAGLRRSSLFFDKAELQGRGFHFSGRGILSKRFDFETRVSDLSSLVADSRGSFSARGWFRWRNDILGAGLDLQGKEIAWLGYRCRELKLEGTFDPGISNTPFELKTRIRGLDSPYFQARDLSGEAKGTLPRHRINLALQGVDGKVQAGLSGAYQEKQWKGILRSFSGVFPQGNPFTLQSPASLEIDPGRILLSSMILTGKTGERFSLSADLTTKPVAGIFSADWQNINLARSRLFLGKIQMAGQTTGWISVNFLKDKRMDLQTSVQLAGSIRTGKRRVDLNQGGLNLSWNEQGLRSSLSLELKDGARVSGGITSSEKGRLAFPGLGKLSLNGEGLDLALFYPENTPGLQARGKIRGGVQGEWTSGPRFALRGRLELVNGSLTWKEKETIIQALVKKGDVGILWAEDSLKGDLALELTDYGTISGDFKFPLPALMPVKVKPAGPLEIDLKGKFRENGLLASLFPEAVQTSRGRISANLSVRGTWEKPSLRGDLEMAGAQADFLPLGIQIRNVSAKAVFDQDRINLSSLELQSGPGRLTGTGTFWLKDWKIARWEGKLKGDRFQIINRPGIEAKGSPNLDITGTSDRIILAGTLEIPEALFSGLQTGGFKRASPDVVIKDPSTVAEDEKVWPVRGEIRLLLGQQVRIKAGGLDAFLQGGLSVSLKDTRSIGAQGEIRVSRGHFQLQNQKLDIVRGRFSFNGPPENPTLDVLALRTIAGKKGLEEWVEEIKAGIAVTGTLNSPLVKLYSSPMMPESDILSYILFGEPLKRGAGKQDLALLSKAAAILLGGSSQGQLAGLLHLDTIEIESADGEFTRSVITVGKYLDPRLFLGVGGSLFDNSYQLILRYSLTPNLEIETRGGTHSSGGIFYKIDFE